MSTALLKASVMRSAVRAMAKTSYRSTAGTTFVRGKATLPDLSCKSSKGHLFGFSVYCSGCVTDVLYLDDYGALEPSISGKIMELHHKNHHQTYVNSLNDATEKLSTAQSQSDIASQIALQPLINFHGGGHINHTLFWENLAPKSSGGGEPPSGKLASEIDTTFGGLDNFKAEFNKALAAIQGSGWAWLVKDKQTGGIGIKTYQVGQ